MFQSLKKICVINWKTLTFVTGENLQRKLCLQTMKTCCWIPEVGLLLTICDHEHTVIINCKTEYGSQKLSNVSDDGGGSQKTDWLYLISPRLNRWGYS